MAITLSDFVTVAGARPHGRVGATAWSDFCHDSRVAAAGQLFVALRTPAGDGHDYIADAVARGCTGVLCQQPPARHLGVTTLVVADTAAALRAWAAHILRRQQPLVIAITGSDGKTTAKELTAALLERRYPGQVFRTRDSYNDRLGIPLALGRLQPEHRFAVIEMGTDAHGEIAELADLVRPVIGAITVIHDAHIGVFGGPEAIAAEKTALWRALPREGVAVVNLADPYLAPWAGRLSCRVLTFAPEAMAVYRTQLLGEHQRVPIGVAVTIARHLGVDEEAIAAGVAAFAPLPGRLRPLPGPAGSTLLDDSESATPAATRAALRVLEGQTLRPRIAILGHHADLGAEAERLLMGLGPAIAAAAEWLIAVGPQAPILTAAAVAAGLSPAHALVADTPAAAADTARRLLAREGPGVVLVKGSREARLERTVAALLADPGMAPTVLVRQTAAWERVRPRNTLRPTWVEIDTLALADNLAAARRRLRPGVRLIAVLKADAYGHGAATVARIVTAGGADLLAVACLPEAQALRRAGITTPILILGYTPPWQARTALETAAGHEWHLTVYDPDVALALNRAALDLRRRVRVHVKVDTGMGRLGLFPEDVPAFLRFLQTLPGIEVVGLFTHLAAADEPDEPYTDLQLARFDALLACLEAEGLRPPLVHAANTAALLTRPNAQYDAVRLGIGLYGLAPGPACPLPSDFRPVLSWKTTVAQVKTLPPGAAVGYGLTYRTTRTETIAIIPVGYADGFRRSPHNWGEVLVRGRRAPLVGRVSMDQAAINVTAIPGVRAGDEVVLIGRQGEETITAADVAARLGTIPYEVVSTILARVPRVPE
ncbi:MAG: alanine racemase [Anaerolineae bacterium]|nr:alanine racemase [Anaerolineae bacterium]